MSVLPCKTISRAEQPARTEEPSARTRVGRKKEESEFGNKPIRKPEESYRLAVLKPRVYQNPYFGQGRAGSLEDYKRCD